MRNLLYSSEFRERARTLIAEAFPEKKRAIFVHIPKCAGTDLTDTIRRRYPTLLHGYFDLKGHAPEAFFQNLHNFAIGVRYADMISLCGHERLGCYQQQGLVRSEDWVFTVIREPLALMYSHISYVLTICRSAPKTRRPDGLGWLELLGISEIPEDASDADMADLGRRVLYDMAIRLSNPICNSLGDGSAITALARIEKSNIEITDSFSPSVFHEVLLRAAEISRSTHAAK